MLEYLQIFAEKNVFKFIRLQPNSVANYPFSESNYNVAELDMDAAILNALYEQTFLLPLMMTQTMKMTIFFGNIYKKEKKYHT